MEKEIPKWSEIRLKIVGLCERDKTLRGSIAQHLGLTNQRVSQMLNNDQSPQWDRIRRLLHWIELNTGWDIPELIRCDKLQTEFRFVRNPSATINNKIERE